MSIEVSGVLDSSVIPSTSRDLARCGRPGTARGAATTTPPAASSPGASWGAASMGGSFRLSPLEVAGVDVRESRPRAPSLCLLSAAAAAASWVRQGVEREPLRCSSRFLVVEAPRHNGEPSSHPDDLVWRRVGPVGPGPRRDTSQAPMSMRPKHRETSTTHDMTATRRPRHTQHHAVATLASHTQTHN